MRNDTDRASRAFKGQTTDLVQKLEDRVLFAHLGHDVLDRDGVAIGIEIRQRLKLRDPAAIDLVADRHLSGLVQKLEDRVLFAHLGHEVTLPAAANHGQHGLQTAIEAPANHRRSRLITNT